MDAQPYDMAGAEIETGVTDAGAELLGATIQLGDGARLISLSGCSTGTTMTVDVGYYPDEVAEVQHRHRSFTVEDGHLREGSGSDWVNTSTITRRLALRRFCGRDGRPDGVGRLAWSRSRHTPQTLEVRPNGLGLDVTANCDPLLNGDVSLQRPLEEEGVLGVLGHGCFPRCGRHSPELTWVGAAGPFRSYCGATQPEGARTVSRSLGWVHPTAAAVVLIAESWDDAHPEEGYATTMELYGLDRGEEGFGPRLLEIPTRTSSTTGRLLDILFVPQRQSALVVRMDPPSTVQRFSMISWTGEQPPRERPLEWPEGTELRSTHGMNPVELSADQLGFRLTGGRMLVTDGDLVPIGHLPTALIGDLVLQEGPARYARFHASATDASVTVEHWDLQPL